MYKHISLLDKFSNSAEVVTNGFTAIIQVILGSVFLAMMAQVSIPLPFSPVPLTLQTLTVALLAATLGRKKAALAVMGYLLQATLGWPVLAGGVFNPLWMIGPRAGYLIGFVAAAYFVGLCLETQEKPTFAKSFLSFMLGEAIILIMGAMWLSMYVGKENALLMGFYPFVVGGLLKATVAAAAVKPLSFLSDKG